MLRGFSGSAEGRLDAIDGPLYEVVDPVTDKIGELVSLQLAVASQEREAVGELCSRSQVIYPTIALVVALFGLIASFLIIRSISKPLQAMRKMMKRVVEKSDLSSRLTIEGSDEIAELGTALNHMMGNFDKVISRLSSVADEVAAWRHTVLDGQ